VIKTLVRASKATAIAERFVGTVRRECLDWLIILNRRRLEHVLREFVDHYTHTVRTPPCISSRRKEAVATVQSPSHTTRHDATASADSSMSTATRLDRLSEPQLMPL
jgi:hypothetical protein